MIIIKIIRIIITACSVCGSIYCTQTVRGTRLDPTII